MKFKPLINIFHMCVIGLGGYLAAKLCVAFGILQLSEALCRLIGIFMGCGGSFSDLLSFTGLTKAIKSGELIQKKDLDKEKETDANNP